MNGIAVPLIAGVVDLQDPHAGAIVDGRELIQPAVRPRDSLQELHVQLQPVTGLRLLIALPALAVRLCSGSLSSLSWGGPGSDSADSVTHRTR